MEPSSSSSSSDDDDDDDDTPIRGIPLINARQITKKDAAPLPHAAEDRQAGSAALHGRPSDDTVPLHAAPGADTQRSEEGLMEPLTATRTGRMDKYGLC